MQPSAIDKPQNHKNKCIFTLRKVLRPWKKEHRGEEEPWLDLGSSTDRTQISVVNSKKMVVEHRETVEQRYYTVTKEKADEATVDNLISTGESERFLQ
ncbi:hypothetical protein L6452_34147 [Arctium lappa]|uniref:Uncharacterized protein n=1 Tax=Arctium lappa TaxID=4217 RepID=A0ACB8YID4_ARCLA|nr:hypothetical protein L6452_34147 [Arctium lappa]